MKKEKTLTIKLNDLMKQGPQDPEKSKRINELSSLKKKLEEKGLLQARTFGIPPVDTVGKFLFSNK